MSKRKPGRCQICGRNLLLNPDNGLCLKCENETLRERVIELELSLVQCRRDKQALYAKLSGERARKAEAVC